MAGEESGRGRWRSRLNWVVAVIGAIFVFCAQTKREDAASNISGWLQWVGFDSLADSLGSTQADTWATIIGSLLVAAAIIFWLWRRRGRVSPLNLPAPSETRLVIEHRMITPGTPIHYPTYMLHMIKVAPEQGGGGLGVTMGGAGVTKAWPSMRYECDVINYGPAALVNVEMSVGLVWQEAIRTERSIKAGDTVLERMWPFTIARIDPGPENKFTFYILNTPDHVISAGFWQEARGQRVDRAASEPIPVTVTAGLPITVFPPLDGEIDTARANTDLAAWDKVQELHLWQVAYLWNGMEPPAIQEALSPKISARLQILRRAVDNEELISVTMPQAGDGPLVAVMKLANRKAARPETVVNREALVDYANALGEQPDFLFGARP